MIIRRIGNSGRDSHAVPVNSHLWARLQQRRAQFAFRLGQDGEAIELGTAADQFRPSAGAEDTTMELGNIGLCLGDLGIYEDAAEYIEKSLAQPQKLNDRLATGLAYHNLGNVRRKQGQYQTAPKQIEEGVRIFRELESRDPLAAALADLASTYLSLANYLGAEEALREGLAQEEELSRPREIAFKYLGLGNLRLEQGELEQARNEFKRVIDITDKDLGCRCPLFASCGRYSAKLVSQLPRRFSLK